MSCDAKLSAQECSSHCTFHWTGSVLSRAVCDLEHHPTIMPCAEALLWIAGNGFSWIGQNIAENCAATCVALLGRNEGGLTLDRATVGQVLKLLHRHFELSATGARESVDFSLVILVHGWYASI